MRINNAGGYEYCRWADKSNRSVDVGIQNTLPVEFFQQHMTPIRTAMLAGESVPGCTECYQMEQHHKVSGRQKQLLKIGVQVDQFAKTLASSPWVSELANDNFTQFPQDWQIDLGNYCNSACVFCTPASSSRLAAEFKKLDIQFQQPLANWTDDPVLVQRFVDTLTQSPHIQYLHFIGGETLITPAFKTILHSLIEAGLNRTATIGFTTNLTVWSPDIIDLLTQFNGVNLGVSIESFETINNYARWPSTLPTVTDILHKWMVVARQQKWLVQLRITPTILTIDSLLTVYDYAWANDINVESCNFLQRPEVMRPSVLPMYLRSAIIDRMKDWLIKHRAESAQIINMRNPSFVKEQIVQDLESYVNYLENEPDESWRLPDLVKYLRQLESARGNSVLTYLPQYEKLFRTAGY
jgi:sulfatase maturation enzyme AslB (radical SAM superfamily)